MASRPCGKDAKFKYVWIASTVEHFVCSGCSEEVKKYAEGAGLPLELIPLTERGKKCEWEIPENKAALR